MHNVTDVAIVTVGSHCLTPPRVAQAGMEQASTRALNDSAHGPLGDAVVLRALRGGDVVWEPQGPGRGIQFAGPVGVEAFQLRVTNEVLERRDRVTGVICRRGVASKPFGSEVLAC